MLRTIEIIILFLSLIIRVKSIDKIQSIVKVSSYFLQGKKQVMGLFIVKTIFILYEYILKNKKCIVVVTIFILMLTIDYVITDHIEEKVIEKNTKKY